MEFVCKMAVPTSEGEQGEAVGESYSGAASSLSIPA